MAFPLQLLICMRMITCIRKSFKTVGSSSRRFVEWATIITYLQEQGLQVSMDKTVVPAEACRHKMLYDMGQAYLQAQGS